jgi:hypothetical protein
MCMTVTLGRRLPAADRSKRNSARYYMCVKRLLSRRVPGRIAGSVAGDFLLRVPVAWSDDLSSMIPRNGTKQPGRALTGNYRITGTGGERTSGKRGHPGGAGGSAGA